MKVSPDMMILLFFILVKFYLIEFETSRHFNLHFGPMRTKIVKH